MSASHHRDLQARFANAAILHSRLAEIAQPWRWPAHVKLASIFLQQAERHERLAMDAEQAASRQHNVICFHRAVEP